MNTKEIKEKILEKYIQRFGDLPPVPMMKCSGEYDPKYIAMLKSALDKNEKVTIDVLNNWFKADKGVIY